jgi:MFS family permease
MLFLLALASESVFILPFVLPRVFRPTFLSVFEISNFELGTAFSAYGIVAKVAYLFGGPLADRYSPKLLLATSLLFTGMSGFYMATIPDLSQLVALYIIWGISTILLFWSASMKAVRAVLFESPGKAFGSVDAVRGLLAAVIASVSVWILALFLPAEVKLATSEEQKEAFSFVIAVFSAFIVLVGILVWMFLRIPEVTESSTSAFTWHSVQTFAKNRLLWLQAIIVLCAYVGYKSTDDFSLLAYDVFGMNEIQSSYLASVSFWMRPIGAFLAGIISDRIGYAKTAMYAFILIILSSTFIVFGLVADAPWIVGLLNIATVSIGIYAVRGVYFALFKESNIPLSVTGTTIGVVSVIGYTPDVFFGPIMGYLLDAYSGVKGHQYVFGVVTAFMLLGLGASFLFEKLRTKHQTI